MSSDSGAISDATRTSTSLLAALKDPSNRNTWQCFVERYQPLIVGYAFRMGLGEEDAQDVAQQTLMAFCTSYQEGNYRREKGRLRSWLFGIARHQVVKALQSHPAREQQMVDDTGQTDYFLRIPAEDQWEQAWEQEWQMAVLRACLTEVRQQVDPQTLEAFDLFAWQGWSAQKVAEKLGMSTNAVFIAKHRVLKRIRQLLPQMEQVW